MHSLPRKRALWMVLLLLLLTAGSTFAQTGSARILRNILDGSKGQLVPNSVATVQDSIYFDPALISKLDTPYQVKNIITFRINEYSNVYLPAQFTATVNARLIYTRPDKTLDSVDKAFTINYDAAGSYTNRSSFVFGKSHRVSVKVLSVTNTAAARVLNALVLENEMQVFPVYKLSCTDDAVKSIAAANAPNTDSTDELIVSWPVATGADVYDLEWTYVDSSAYNSNKYGNPIDPVLLFRNNASRVTIANNSYSIPLLYDNGGILFFRVRAVQEKSMVSRIETSWSSAFAGGLGRYGFTGHQRNLNWQMTVDYAEEGKRKAVVNYYDGSLRSRQVVTKDNTTNKTTIAESFYDHQGRPVIQVMPAPSVNSAIKYSPRFNSALNGAEYDKSNYDQLNSPSEYLTAKANAMSSATGANQYYSPNNPNKNNGINQYIPDAGGFAFAETVYTQDNTGRISTQGGVGAVHQIGSTHETKYYYGSPGENDLDVLFGTDAGDKSHYFKNMVQDANGQYAISYLDMYGRTVATALAGTPDSANLDNISSNTSFPVTDTLSGANSNVIKDLVMENTQSQLVVMDGDYQFKYSLTPPVLQKKDCNNNTVCYIGRYDLEIKITDDAYNQRLGGKPFDTIVRNYAGAIVTDCNTPPPMQVAFSLRLPRGNYQITKRLTVNRDAMSYYRDSIFMKRNGCTTLEQFIQQQRDFFANTECIPNCAACQDSIGTWDEFRTRYMVAGAISMADTANYRGEAQAAYADAVAACEVLCGKATEVTDIRTAMLLDVSAPSGQYADAEDTLNIYSIFYQPDENTLPPYKRDTVTYLDEAGRPDLVYDELSNFYVTPQRLRPEQFAARFKPSWAPALLKFHPEYCKWLELQKHQASYAWDREFEKIDTYAEAKALGYLNPLGQTNVPNVPYPAVAGNRDPLSLESTEMYNALQAKLMNYNGGSGSQTLTMWSTATATVKCEGNTISCITAYAPANAPFNESVLCTGDLDMAWRNFRQLYLAVKRGIIDNKIKTASCPSGVTNPTATVLLAAGKQLNFNNAADALNQNGLGYLNNGSETEASVAVNGAIQQHYEDNCNAYARAWVQQLAPCRYSQAMLDILIPRLVGVCMEGSDATHPMGSSSVRPASSNQWRSFQDVLNDFNEENNIATGVDCNEYMITAPAPYDKQTGYSNKPAYTKPADCECEKLNNLRNEYFVQRQPGDVTFAAYLSRTRQINMLDADLTFLVNACNTTSSCTYFEKVITLPPALQCNTGEICVPCNVVRNTFARFTARFPAITPTIAEADSLQRKRNTLFANFMNNELGFSKQAWEYLQFLADCPTPFQPLPACTTLTKISDDFRDTYPMSDDNMVTVTKRVPTLSITHLLGYKATAYFPVNGNTLAAAVWWMGLPQGNTWFRFRDNIVFNFNRIARGADITEAGMNLFAKPSSAEGELFTASQAHYTSEPGTISCLFSRSRVPVVAEVTPWSDQLNIFEENTLTLAPIKTPESMADYLDQRCTNLVADMYRASLTGNDFGLIMRLSEEPNQVLHSFVFWSHTSAAPADKRPFLNVTYTAPRCEEFVVFFNERFGPNANFTSAQIDSIYKANCGVVTGICAEVPPTPPHFSGPLLCGKSTPVFPPTDVNTINNCSDTAFFAISKGTELYNAYRDSLRGSFEKDYVKTGLLAAGKEVFTVSYTNSEYHYTLFYYDQAGNLVKTVPPAGVVVDRSDAWIKSVNTARATGKTRVPAHKKVTQYRYNTLNKLHEQQTPDGGITRFWYDKLGRLVLSRNARQLPLHRYNYVFYDALGRVYETGDFHTSSVLRDSSVRRPDFLQRVFSGGRTTCKEIVRTTYDVPYTPLAQLVLSARNLRNRIAWTATYNTIKDMQAGRHTAASFYSYDIHGNVDTLVQDYRVGGMADAGNRFKKIVYKYDLISGNVKQVAYQPSQADAFYHRYTYDAENRLINVETSKDSVYWENDAYYSYYRHGQLARKVLGQQQVQGMDYAYTLQGWIKGVNATHLASPTTDMGRDGAAGSQVARDAAGYAVYYYGIRDYKSIANLIPFASVGNTGLRPLFNGNISASSQYIQTLGESLLSLYNYDQLNRIKRTEFKSGLHPVANTWAPVTIHDFKEDITYDDDGNIRTYARNGSPTYAGGPLAMDNLTYNYKAGKNQLDFIADTVNSSNYDVDIDNQSAGNYVYDTLGNLVKDRASGIDTIIWNTYGKIASITKADGTTISYTYDALSNRISNTVNGVQTWYVRDASGNVMSIYTGGANAVNSGNLTQTEVYLYGSDRLGVSTLSTNVQNVVNPETLSLRGLGVGTTRNFIRGKKLFEFSNYLGNVLATVSDKKKGVSSDSTTVSYFQPDIVSAQEYYPFGMIMPGRSKEADKYRYGFNGKENDNDVKGTGNHQDYGLRVYDPRIGRFLSVDPLEQEYPWYTPYQFAGNDVIRNIDIDGAEPGPATGDEKEGDRVERTYEGRGYGGTTTVLHKEWIYHEGGLNGSQAGWMTAEDYNDDVLKPLVAAYDRFRESGSYDDFVVYNDFANSRKGDLDYVGVVAGASQYMKENPTYDSWARWIPVWGSGKQAYLDFSVGKYGEGAFSTALAVSDAFLLKAVFWAPAKAAYEKGLTHTFKSYYGIGKSHAYGASVSRWRALGLDVSGAKHHWLISQKLMERYPILKQFGNQRWNLTRFSSQAEHMRWAHFQTFGNIRYPGARFLYPITSTPTWFKLSTTSIGGRLIE